ncbi:Oidioi.mRNA.OKI2018_I69.chr2.g6028.t1.cds [Oikopleura dioica]|uniref:Oidioi.mRNA.OKI2018_I69.chr2.g6028.t1.cds n=1 Tax=Oikopleura dioica TaxID=34765 RepID=A0ABN7T8T8_OIKDI|nr:Oidioi.mRNA.OKI2018_I69.chr2.g6028.t1.cds [Oikopleura dioica]
MSEDNQADDLKEFDRKQKEKQGEVSEAVFEEIIEEEIEEDEEDDVFEDDFEDMEESDQVKSPQEEMEELTHFPDLEDNGDRFVQFAEDTKAPEEEPEIVNLAEIAPEPKEPTPEPKEPTPEPEEEEEEIEVVVPDMSDQDVLSKNLSGRLFNYFDSFGYDSAKRLNLHLFPSDEETHSGQVLLHSAGNLLLFHNVQTDEKTVLRSPAGSIGSVCIHPSKKFFAVGGKGDKPEILIYSYPEMEVVYVLRGGAEKGFSHVEFNHDGSLLASVSSTPDYLLTLWNWKTQSIVLRSKAYSLDVFQASFSPDIDGQLTSCGIGHIRFWNMAETFTGLKLQGALGRFGRTSVSDIDAFVQLPDGKVISGCEWGNLLVWDGGLIKVEITRKGGKSCHDGSIKQMFILEGELLTIGVDGAICVWDIDTIDQADTTETSMTFELDPMNCLKVPDAAFSSMIMSSEDDSVWFAQDQNGAIWELDLSFSHTTKPPKILDQFHGGNVVDMCAHPTACIYVSTGDRQVRIIDIPSSSALAAMKFPVKGTSVCWPNDTTIVVGFEDGTVRNLSYGKMKSNHSLLLRQAIRPHGKTVNSIHSSPNGKLIGSSSDDGTVFIFSLKDNTMEAVGFVSLGSMIKDFTWVNDSVLLCWSKTGAIFQVTLPEISSIDTSVSFSISNVNIVGYQFQSCKGKRARARAKAKFDDKLAKLKKSCDEKLKAAQKKAADMGDQVKDDEIKNIYEPVNSMEFEELEEYFFVPETVGEVIWAKPADEEGYVLCQMAGYDHGLVYKCKLSEFEEMPEPVDPEDAFMLDEDFHVTSWSEGKNRIYAGSLDGKVRIYQTEKEHYSEADLENGFESHHTIAMHDCQLGSLSKIILTSDQKWMISAGLDGNVFAYGVTPVDEIELRPPVEIALDDLPVGDEVKGSYSLEEAKQKSEYDRRVKEANLLKIKKRKQIESLIEKFDKLKDKNAQLPEACQLLKKDFEINQKLTAEAEQALADKLDLIQRQNQWDLAKAKLRYEKVFKRFRGDIMEDPITLHAIQSSDSVKSYELRSLPEELKEALERSVTAEKNVRENSSRGNSRGGGRGNIEETQSMSSAKISETAIDELPADASRAQRKAEEKKARKEKRKREWEELMKQKPDDNRINPKDEEEIRIAKKTLGYFHLKTSKDYIVPDHLRSNTNQKKRQIALLSQEIFRRKETFNKKVRAGRDEKIAIRKDLLKLCEKVKELEAILPEEEHKIPPAIPEIRPEETNEHKFQLPNRASANKFSSPSDTGLGRARSAQALAQSIGVSSKTQLIDRSGRGSGEAKALTEFEQAELTRKIVISRFERDQALEKAAKRISNFDKDVRTLYVFKARLDEDLVLAELRLDTLHQELILLKDFEKRENAILERVEKKEAEIDEASARASQVKARLDSKRKEVEKLAAKEKDCLSDFQRLIGENNKFENYLTKVYKKKIKRATQSNNDGSGSDSDSDSDDDDEDYSDEDSDAEPFDDTVCPANCDQEQFDKTILLRAHRCAIEDDHQDAKKASESLRKEHDALSKKIKLFNNQLKSSMEDLDAFQQEKQGKLNELWVVVPLEMSQILIEQDFEKFPVKQGLVVPSEKMNRLSTRIEELMGEKENEKLKYRKAKQQHVHLVKGNKDIVNQVKALDEKCNQAMMLKFGRIVDIDSLAMVTVPRAVEEGQRVNQQNEINLAREELEMDKKILALREELAVHVKENTDRIAQITMMKGEDYKLKFDLDIATSDTRPQHLDEQRIRDEAYRRETREIIQEQENEINLLKDEIIRLTRKGGHLLPHPSYAADHAGDH